jgi:hypothetical protein
MKTNLKVTLYIIAILLTIGAVKKAWFPDNYIDESRVTDTHFYGGEKRDPNREVYQYDYKANKYIYMDELPKSKPKKKVQTYIYKKTNSIDQMVDDKIQDYIEDHYDELQEDYEP